LNFARGSQESKKYKIQKLKKERQELVHKLSSQAALASILQEMEALHGYQSGYDTIKQEKN